MEALPRADANCPHDELFFGSGHFYLICARCYFKWVACGAAADGDIDYKRGGTGPGSEKERFRKYEPPPEAPSDG